MLESHSPSLSDGLFFMQNRLHCRWLIKVATIWNYSETRYSRILSRQLESPFFRRKVPVEDGARPFAPYHGIELPARQLTRASKRLVAVSNLPATASTVRRDREQDHRVPLSDRKRAYPKGAVRPETCFYFLRTLIY